MKLYDGGVYLLDGKELIADGKDALAEIKSRTGAEVTREQAAAQTIAYEILKAHNVSGSMDKLQMISLRHTTSRLSALSRRRARRGWSGFRSRMC